MGIITVVLFFINRKDKFFKWMRLAVLLSFTSVMAAIFIFGVDGYF